MSSSEPDPRPEKLSLHDESEPVRKKSSWNEYVLARVPGWVKRPLPKLLARCWLASWASFVLILPNSSLKTFGNAAFFACMTSIMMPPMFPVQIFIYFMGTLIMGSLFGWAWGCAAMKAALTARDNTLLLSQIQRVQEVASQSANPDAEFQLEVFHGEFLQFRSSLVFGVFLGVGAFFLAVARASSPRLALSSIFGTIFLDVICSYGPLFPAPNYTILESFLISTAASMAISCATIILVFPETLNHSMLKGITDLLGDLRSLIEFQEKVLSAKAAEELGDGSELANQIQAMLDGAIAGMQKISMNAPMLSVEFSYGRFNGEDVKSLIDPLVVLGSRVAGLQNLRRMVGTKVNREQAPQGKTLPDLTSTTNDSPDSIDTSLWKQLASNTNHADHVTIQDIFPLLHTATADLRKACCEALQVCKELLTHVNITRWGRRSTTDVNIDEKLDELRCAIDEFKDFRRKEVLAPFRDLQKAAALSGNEVRRRRVLFYMLVFEANLLWVAEATLAFGEQLAEMAQKHAKSRLWPPKSLRSAWKIIMMTEERESAPANTDFPADPIEVERSQMAEKRDPDSRRPSNMFQHIGEFIFQCYSWCKTPTAVYAFKYTFITVALWLPSVFKPTAYINYVNRGLWALIMAQTTLEPYIADQIFSYVARLTATSVGIILGLAGWYIGAGNGSGNPYGVAAVMAVLLVPILFWRIFTPSFLPAIMCGITIILVVGYSWVDGHLMLLSNPGVGWSVAWRRWLLVLIGSGASAVMMLIPPRSAKKAVRIENASLIYQLSQLYATLVSEWIIVEEPDDGKTATPEKLNSEIKHWAQHFRNDFTKISISVQTLKLRTAIAKWEGSFRGAWPAKEYKELNDIETDMLSYIAQLAGALYHLDPKWRQRLLHQTKFLNPNFVSDMMSVFSLVSRSLRTAEPLQETLPKNLVERIFYHHRRDGRDDTVNDHWEELDSLEYLNFAAGVTAVYMIVLLLDRLHQVTIELCGEVPMRGYAEWRQLHRESQRT